MIITKNRPRKIIDKDVPDVILSVVNLPEPKNSEIPLPPKRSEVSQIKDVRIRIVPDNQVIKTEVPTVDDLQNAVISTITQQGSSTDGTTGELNATGGNLNAGEVKTDKQQEVDPIMSDAKYPGGKEAFAKFLTKYLITPGELEAGEKKTVLVRFMVDADGTISKTEVLQSDGEDYTREVIRVLAKMPKWIPAMQNGTKVATWFTQPVIFIGVE